MFVGKLTTRLLVAAAAFVLGLVVSLPFRVSAPAPGPSPRSAESACELLQKPGAGLYENVRLSGILYGNADGSLLFNEQDCAGSGFWMKATFTDSLLENGEAARFLERMRRQSTGETMARAEVLLVGRVIKREGSPQGVIEVTQLERTAPVSIVSFVSN